MHEHAGSSRGVLSQLLNENGYGLFIAAIFLTTLAIHIQTVAVTWQVYDQTRDPVDLGLIGLSQFLPALLLVLVTGAVADRYSRRKIMMACILLKAVVAACLLGLTTASAHRVGTLFLLMILYGVSRAFYVPARQSLVPNIVPREHLSRALALNSSVNQSATICGPALGGLLYAVSPKLAYGVSLGFLVIGAMLVLGVGKAAQQRAPQGRSWRDLTAGFRFIGSNRVVLGAMSLDLFVVLLGGAYALLPIYARDILDIGPAGLGILRTAPAIGAVTVALWMARHPIASGAGRVMFMTVALFCVATLVFGLSRIVWLSVLALVVAGGSDMVSVVIRNTIIQLNTGDEVRGRVNAIGQVFVGASNEVGAFRAGTMAAVVGPVASVVGGAVVALGICGAWMRLFPELRGAGNIEMPGSVAVRRAA